MSVVVSSTEKTWLMARSHIFIMRVGKGVLAKYHIAFPDLATASLLSSLCVLLLRLLYTQWLSKPLLIYTLTLTRGTGATYSSSCRPYGSLQADPPWKTLSICRYSSLEPFKFRICLTRFRSGVGGCSYIDRSKWLLCWFRFDRIHALKSSLCIMTNEKITKQSTIETWLKSTILHQTANNLHSIRRLCERLI